MKFWILLLVAGLLLLWGAYRERFDATASIKAPPYDDAGKTHIYDVASTASQRKLEDKAKEADPTLANDPGRLKIAAGGLLAGIVGDFFTQVFQPATTPITVENVTTFLAARPASDLRDVEQDVLKAYFVEQQGVGTAQRSGYADMLAAEGQNVGYLTGGSTSGGTAPPLTTESPPADAETTPGTCPSGTTMRSYMCYGESSSTVTPACPAGYVVDQSTMDLGVPDHCAPTSNQGPMRRRECPTGMEADLVNNTCTPKSTPVCPSGYAYTPRNERAGTGGVCTKTSGSASSSVPGGGQGTTTGTTTGGGSVSSYGPTSGGYGSSAERRKQVFGPVFTGRGSGGNGTVPADTSQTNRYPELLGGMPDISTRIPGAGIVSPSQNWNLTNNGSLPSSASLGADDLSRFLPFSRQPGDMDVIPDPYRVSQSAVFSSKTEPVPFLTDFSAFFR